MLRVICFFKHRDGHVFSRRLLSAATRSSGKEGRECGRQCRGLGNTFQTARHTATTTADLIVVHSSSLGSWLQASKRRLCWSMHLSGSSTPLAACPATDLRGGRGRGNDRVGWVIRMGGCEERYDAGSTSTQTSHANSCSARFLILFCICTPNTLSHYHTHITCTRTPLFSHTNLSFLTRTYIPCTLFPLFFSSATINH